MPCDGSVTCMHVFYNIGQLALACPRLAHWTWDMHCRPPKASRAMVDSQLAHEPTASGVVDEPEWVGLLVLL